MKLVEILARDLVEWPERVKALEQMAMGEIIEAGNCAKVFCVTEKADFPEIVTRPQWQAERDRMKAMESIELKDTEGLREALKDWEAAGKPMGDWVTITEPTVSYEQELWDTVASRAIGGIVSSNGRSQPATVKALS